MKLNTTRYILRQEENHPDFGDELLALMEQLSDADIEVLVSAYLAEITPRGERAPRILYLPRVRPIALRDSMKRGRAP